MLKKVSSKPLSEICSVISSGGTPSRKMSHYFDQNGHLWVKSKELLFQGIDDTEEKISDEGLKKSSAKYYPEGSVLVAMYGANVGQLAWLKKPATVNQAICALVIDKQKADNKFVYYSLLYTREKLIVQAQGAAQQNLNAGQIRSFEIPYFDLESQQKIASILSAYDDLIENNNRRIAILEEMARSLYREWFVKFRFPGHEEVKMVDSELGQIPEGWRVVYCPEAIEINPTVKIQKDNLNPFVPMDALSENSMIIKYNQPKKGNSGSKFMNGDTLFARITPSLENGKTGYVQFISNEQSVGFGSTEFIVLRSKLLTPEYVYCLARSNEFRENAIKSMTGASGRQRVQNECFNNFMLALPITDILASFSRAVKPMFDSIYNLHKRNTNLQAQRDMLLPKLISGKISIQISEE